jgi:hypothetical protein
MIKDFIEKLIHVCLPMLCLLIGIGQPADICAGTVEEYSVKAALIFNFARFTEWPSYILVDSQETFNICIVGDDTILEAFGGVAGRQIKGCRIVVTSVNRMKISDSCNLLFVSGSDRSILPKIFAAVEGKPVLTIGEMTGFAEVGGIINLVRKGKRINFEVNLKAARQAGLKISSRILKLATIVGGLHKEKEK